MMVKPKITWQGLDSSRFKKYKSWKNTHKPGLCGTYVVASLIHDFLWTCYGIDMDKDYLLQGVKPVVDNRWPYRGTFFWDLQGGLNDLLKPLGSHRAQSHLLPDLKVVEILSSSHPRPLAIGTARLLGSRYQNHWLLAYAYGYDEEGRLYFRCYDNHGKHDAVITATESLACVWLEEI